MIPISWLKKIWNGRSKGISTVLGTVFLTLVVFAISTNVFLWTLSRNAEYTLAVKEENQKTADRLNEYVIASNANYSVSNGTVALKVTVRNVGSVAVQIINLWVFDTNPENKRFTNKTINLSLNPSDAVPFKDSVTIPGANTNHTIVSWFVTARGNTVPLEAAQQIIVAELSQGIGSISMDFPTFRYYEVQPGDILGPAQYDFNVPATKNVVFGVCLTNLDESHADINLTHHSCFWLSVPSKSAMEYWSITGVEDETIVPFDFQILEWGQRTLVYFGPNSAQQLGGHPAAANILLYGTIGEDDYGQNIPFISLYMSP